jgi:enterobacterial common antigen flippase
MIQKPTRNIYIGTFATSLFIQGCTVLQGVLLARLLGPIGRGEFATVILWPNVFAGIGILGINMAIARLSGQGQSPEGLVKTAVRAALITGVMTALACGLALPYLLPEGKHNLLTVTYLFLLFAPLNHLALNLQGIDHGIGNFAWLNGTRAVLYPVYFSGLLLCWFFAADKVFWAVAALLVANASVVLFRLLPMFHCLFEPSRSVGTKVLFKESQPFVGASIISICYTEMDKALLVWLLDSSEIGWYVAALAAAGSINVLNNSLGIVQFSAAAKSQAGYGFNELASVLRRACVLSLLGGAVLGILLPWLVPLVYGADFQPATVIAYCLLPGLVLSGLGGIVNQALRGQGQPIAGVISKVLGLVVMGILGYVLASKWGGKGIAFGYLCGELVAFGGLLIVAIHYYKDAALSALWPTTADVLFLWNQIQFHKRAAKI